MPTDDPSDRPPLDPERFYTEPSIDTEEDDEYELEPVDAHVLEQERLRAAEQVRSAKQAVDIDAVYRELNDTPDPTFSGFKLKFGVKHLLIGITAVALLLGMLRSGMLGGSSFAVLIFLTTVALAGVNFWFGRVEQQRQQRAMLRRQQELARARGEVVEPLEEDEPIDASLEAMVRDAIRSVRNLRFGLREIASAVVIAAAFMALPSVLGRDNAWALMGLAMISGLGCVAADVRPPRFVIAGWLIALAGYLLLTIVTAIGGALGF